MNASILVLSSGIPSGKKCSKLSKGGWRGKGGGELVEETLDLIRDLFPESGHKED